MDDDIDEDDDDLDDWNLNDDDDDDDDEGESTTVLCLFCEESFPKMSEFHLHSKSKHEDFELKKFAKRLHLDSISFIKCVNYVRKNRVTPAELNRLRIDYSKPIPWSSDEFMFPVVPDDPLLMIDIEDDFEDVDGNTPDGLLDSDMETSVTLSNNDYAALLKRLRESESRAQSAEERLSAAAEDLSKMKIFAEEFVMNQSVEKEVKSHPNANVFHSIRADEDSSYSSSYSHYGIHHEMLRDKSRTCAYRDAINNLDLEDKIVLDLGCGTGILSLFAAKKGAKHVYAVDMSDVIYQAMDIARENNLHDKITFLKGRIEDLELPVSKVDVIVSEWMGYFLLFESMLDSVLYARDRWLQPEGLLLPDRCTISIGGLGDPTLYTTYVSFWEDVYSFKMSCMKSEVVVDGCVLQVASSMLSTEMQIVKEIDINSCRSSDLDFTQDFSLRIDAKTDVLYGLVGSFDVSFGPYSTSSSSSSPIVLSTSPAVTPTHWKQTVFFFPQPLKVTSGESLEGRIDVRKDPKEPRSLIVKLSMSKLAKQLVYHLR